jgi:hypothetical protein
MRRFAAPADKVYAGYYRCRGAVLTMPLPHTAQGLSSAVAGHRNLWRVLVTLAVALGLVGWIVVAGRVTAISAGAMPAVVAPNLCPMTFDEPFDSLDVSARGPNTRWIAHTPWNGDFGDAQFVDPGPNGPFSVSHGLLSISMNRGEDGRWGSGLLASSGQPGSGFSQGSGYFEVRAKLPEGPGVWPAFWLSVIGTPGRATPEIDIFEHYGHDPAHYLATGHVWKDGAELTRDVVSIPIPSGSLSADFHMFGAVVSPSGVGIYFDRKLVATLPPRPEYLHDKLLLLDLAAGGGWPIDKMPDHRVMLVDFVRAFALCPAMSAGTR